MKFVARASSWVKRRAYEVSPIPKKLEVIGFEKIHNHSCSMIVEYENGDRYELSGRVSLNSLAKPERWTVQGLNPTGISVIVDLIEDE